MGHIESSCKSVPLEKRPVVAQGSQWGFLDLTRTEAIVLLNGFAVPRYAELLALFY